MEIIYLKDYSCLVNELAVDWRHGAAYFEQQLLDYDVASNWGNWQYLAGVGADPCGKRHFDLEATNLTRDSYQKQWVMNNTLSTLSGKRKFAHLSH